MSWLASRAAAAVLISSWNAYASARRAVLTSASAESVVRSSGPVPVSMQAYSGSSYWCGESRLRTNPVRIHRERAAAFRACRPHWVHCAGIAHQVRPRPA
jgi:hypothetical protein